jgi:caffeoyl-CoA O-methyltransferase
MKRLFWIKKQIFCTLFAVLMLSINVQSNNIKENPELDEKVKAFLEDSRNTWRDMNVPATDGQLLHDLIVKNGYKSAVEIGTSTGHSGVWMAWALSKTGGKLITIEIDEDRHRQALENFKKAGVSEYVDARLANAHDLVPQLKGPFDFVFSDADKDWYKNYFIEMAPKLKVGGCYTSHNVQKGRTSGWVADYVEYIESREDFKTTIDERGGGMSVSYKIR